MKEMEERELREEDLKKAIEEAWAKRLQLPVDRFVSKERFLMQMRPRKGRASSVI
ncbi:hypothetical protein [Mesotoga sp. Brook.08.YT.4.2.5.1]|uniref:hypothetical protein n=1 Tax=Mesotoga sp. Brook.08.YT.4.2.5.1 TaxID=1421001 RepID=UPI0021553608|nr:hypothetical protein [Mesotoga sp. Brook.08.YT.4.2.5.1]